MLRMRTQGSQGPASLSWRWSL